MPRKLTLNEFIERATKVHNNKYDYSLVQYISSTEKVNILCGIHGVFNQVVANHLNGKGCKYCYYASKKRVKQIKTTTKKDKQVKTKGIKAISDEEFIKKCQKIHNNKYGYEKTKFIKSNEKIIITCKIHGDFEQTREVHKKGRGCFLCYKEKTKKEKTYTTEIFIKKAEIKHSHRYTYNKTVYVNAEGKVIITCKTHGDFEQIACNHLLGRGCILCAKEVTKQQGGYTRSEFIKKANGRECTFYTLKCFNDTEEFYKIGRTVNSVKVRYCNKKSMPYNYEIVSEIKGEAGEIWDLELMEKRKLKKYNFQPHTSFGGSATECFTKYTID